jgi:chaperonin GroEL (HSP60 family)
VSVLIIIVLQHSVLCIFRRIENPRIVLLDCNLEYKKGESQVFIYYFMVDKPV